MKTAIVGRLKGGPLVAEPEIKGTHEVVLAPTPFIKLISDVMFAYTEADIVAVSPNGYHVNCPEGNITKQIIDQMYVYSNNTLYTVRMKGRQILEWMEWSYEFFGKSATNVTNLTDPAVNLDIDLTIPYGTKEIYLFDEFAGLHYTVDLTMPVGERIAILGMENGDEFDLRKEYLVATTNYRVNTNLLSCFATELFDGRDRAVELVQANISSQSGFTNMPRLIQEYIEMQPNQTIYNESRNNWQFVNLNWNQDQHKKAVKLINSGKLSYDHHNTITKDEIEIF